MVGLERIPLFPLNVVLFPRMPLPLHIFEPRYRRMIGQCIADSLDFGVILQTGNRLSRTGCTARIERIIGEHPDGSFDILTRGEKRFKVRRFISDEEYLTGEIETFADLPEKNTPRYRARSRMAAEGLLRLAAIEDLSMDTDILIDLPAEELSLIICGTDLFTLPEKQEMLETTDTLQRLDVDIKRIGRRLRQRNAEKKIEELLGAEIDFKALVN